MRERVILKTIVSSENELNLVNLNIIENSNLVDIFIVSEANITHSGEFREYLFEKYFADGLIENPEKVKYVKVDLTDVRLTEADHPNYLHENEQKIRDGFRQGFEISANDIVISVDADEIIYNLMVKKLSRKLRSRFNRTTSFELRLHQFAFRLSNYWPHYLFQGPVICKASHFLSMQNPQWRYSGKHVRKRAGCHLSWMMTPEQIQNKMLSWAHADETREFADLKNIQDAIIQGLMPWDKNVKMIYKVVDPKTFRLLPSSLQKIINRFDPQLL